MSLGFFFVLRSSFFVFVFFFFFFFVLLLRSSFFVLRSSASSSFFVLRFLRSSFFVFFVLRSSFFFVFVLLTFLSSESETSSHSSSPSRALSGLAASAATNATSGPSSPSPMIGRSNGSIHSAAARARATHRVDSSSSRRRPRLEPERESGRAASSSRVVTRRHASSRTNLGDQLLRARARLGLLVGLLVYIDGTTRCCVVAVGAGAEKGEWISQPTATNERECVTE